MSADNSRGRSGYRAGIAAGLMGFMALGAATAPVSALQLVGPDVTVRYDDLDINTTAGAEMLYRRIQLAAAQVCPQVASQQLAEYAATLRCRDQVVAHAVNGVSSPKLAAVYAARAHHGVHGQV